MKPAVVTEQKFKLYRSMYIILLNMP